MSRAPACSEDIRAEVAELLGVRADAVHPGHNLIGQGLDSIRMMTLAGRWRRQGIVVDFASLAAAPTIDAWFELVAASRRGADEASMPAGAQSSSAGREEGEPFALAPMQHAMWIGRQDNQRFGGVAGHLYVEFDHVGFDGGAIDPDRLRAAATKLAARHPMLRVEFLPDGTQRVPAGHRDFPVAVVDLRADPDPTQQRLAEIRDTKSSQQLDGAVFELALTLLPGERSRLHVDLDMQAADAMSYRTLMADLAALYRGADLPELGYTYREYRQAVSGEDARPQQAREADREWWAKRIPDLPDPPMLPTISGKEACCSTRLCHWLDPVARDALFSRARARGITPAMTLAAAFTNALARWSATSRFLLNVPLFARQALHPDVDRLVGDFTSSLLLDIDFTGAHTAATRAQVVQEAMRTAHAHSAYPGLSVLRDLGRHRGAQVLAPVVFTSALGLGELFSPEVTEQFGTPGWIISQGPQVLLDAQVTEFDGGVLVNWDVRDGVFAPGVIDAMFAYHVDELRTLAADDAWDAPGPPALQPAQRAVREAVNSHTAVRSGEALHDGFFRQAELRPDAPALIAGSGDLSYAQLRDQVLAVVAALRGAGIGAGDTVAVVGPKTAEQVPAVLGILAAGGAYLPIGADQPRDRAERILEAGSVGFALVSGGQPMPLPVPALKITDALCAVPPSDMRPVKTDPAELAYVLFTSGSTGEPKGVELTHASVMNTVEFFIDHFGIGGTDRWLALSTLESDMSVPDIFVALRTGGAIVVVDETQRRDPDAWARLVDIYKVTALNFMPGWLDMLLEVGQGRLSSLRAVAVGGDWVRPELARRLRAEAPGARFAGLGGATETAVHATIFDVDFYAEDASGLPADWTAVPYGLPLPNNACRVVNDAGDDCPDWVVGELWVSGRGIADGYRGRPELTAERFVEHPFRGEVRTWYRTADLARYWPDGTLEFIGRADHRIKISGYRVELGEVEAALGRVPGVRTAVAALVPVSDGSEVLAAAVRVDMDGPAGLTCERIRRALADLVPAYMVPEHISLVERIPFTEGGKIDRKAVAARLSQAAEVSGDEVQEPPRTRLERALCDIVADILGRDRDAVGLHGDFFSLGGDSVLATQAVVRIRQWLDSPGLMVADVFAAPTPDAMARLLISRESTGDRLEQVADVYLEIAAMDSADVMSALDPRPATQPARLDFQPWVKRFTASGARGSLVVFPHAGGAAAAYRSLARTLSANNVDAFVVQYPQRADRRNHPVADSIEALALELFEAGDWRTVSERAPLSLFGHCMGAVVAFEFARIAERNGVPVRALWASAGQAPSTVAASGPLPTSDDDVLADMVDLGGTDPALLEDEEFAELLVKAVRADYRALSGYSCAPGVRIRADIHALGGERDHRISREMLTSWDTHTSGRFALSYFAGGHFYLNDHLDAVARMVSADAG